MKKIVTVSGSPRPKGNTYKILKEIEAVMTSHGEYSFEHVSLKKLSLSYCKGCLKCMKKGEETCPCRDDAVGLRDTLLSADGIVFASPVYVHTVSALMKNFYDRFAYMCHQPHFRNKAAMFVVTSELSGVDETLEYMRFPAFTWGFRLSADVGVVYPAYTESATYRASTLRHMEQAVAAFEKDITGVKRAPSFKELAFFYLMKTKVTLHKELLPADYQYWKKNGWMERAFYDENSIPFIRSRLAKMMVSLRVKRMIRALGLEKSAASASI